MGMATSWLKSLFGFGGKKKCKCSEWKGSGCGFLHNPTTIPPNISPSEAAWLWSFYKGVERERLSKLSSAASSDSPISMPTTHASVTDCAAALRIQTLFRAYLARKALRALRALVKLQAHVRGFLVRKRAKETLLSMQALFRAQATIISQRGRINLSAEKMKEPSRNLTTDCKIVEVDTSVGISKPKNKSRCNNLSQLSDLCDDFVFQRSAPLPAPFITESSGFGEQDFKFSTAHSTPRFGRFYESDFVEQESYLSGKARVRSLSAPKQRPEVTARKKMASSNMVEPRKSLSGGRIQTACSQMDDDLGFKNVVAGKLGRSFDERQSWKHNLRYLQ